MSADGPDAGSLRRLLSGFAVLAAGSVAGQIVSFVALAVVARRIGPENLGAYQFAFALTQYFAIPVNLGVGVLAIRDVAREPARVREVAGEVMVLLALLSALAYGLLLALTPLLATTDAARTLLPITGLTFVIQAFGLEWALQGLRRLGTLAVLRLVSAAIAGGLSILLVDDGLEGARTYAWLVLVAWAILAGGSLLAVLRGGGGPALCFDPGRLRRRFVRSVPFGVSLILIQVYYSLDSVMLGYLRDDKEVGIYAAAYRIPLAVAGFAGLWVTALYPHAAEVFESEPDRLRRQVGRLATLSLLAALPFGIAATLLATDLMPAIFGDPYAAAATPFALLAWSAAIIIVSVNFGNVLLAAGDERFYIVGVGAGALLNVALNFILIPPFGVEGAGIATISAEALVLVVMAVRFRRRLGPPPLEAGRALRGLGAAVCLAVVLLLLRDEVVVWVAAATGAAVYVAAALVLGAARPRELRALLRR